MVRTVLAFAVLLVLVITSSADADEAAKHTGFKFTAGPSTLRFYGFARLDIAYTDSRTSHPQAIQWILSESSDVPPGGNYAYPDDAELSIYPKLSRFGFDMKTPAADGLGNAKLSGKIEIDFYNATASESRTALRMRHAFMKLAWTRAAVTVGQLSDLMSPLYPTANNDMIMWNAGNLGDRRPQVRMEVFPHLSGGNKLALQAMLGQTGAVDGQRLNGGAGLSALDGVRAAIPMVQGRLGWTGEHFWIENKTYQLGVWGHVATEALPKGVPDIAGENEWTSSSFGFDVKLPLHDKLLLQVEGWAGQNLSDVRGGIGQGVNNVAKDPNRGKEIESTGGWAELTVQATPAWAVSVGGSMDDPETNLPEAGAREKNTVFYLANRIKPGGGVTVGLDYLNWTTEWSEGMPDGKANRIKIFGQYNF